MFLCSLIAGFWGSRFSVFVLFGSVGINIQDKKTSLFCPQTEFWSNNSQFCDITSCVGPADEKKQTVKICSKAKVIPNYFGGTFVKKKVFFSHLKRSSCLVVSQPVK